MNRRFQRAGAGARANLARLAPCVLALALRAGAAGAPEPAPSPGVPAGYVLDWHDEFDGGQLDGAKWEFAFTGKTRGRATFSRDSVSVAGGVLRLATFQKDGQLYTGRLSTQTTYRRACGYFEARVKTPAQGGQHAAFWLLAPTYGATPGDAAGSGAEIDVFESYGDDAGDRRLAHNVYWNAYAGAPVAQTRWSFATGRVVTTNASTGPLRAGACVDFSQVPLLREGAKLSDEFHLFGLLWTPSNYVFSVDGHETFRTTEGLSARPEFLQLSVMCGEGDVGRLDAARLPDAMTVDYVRVYAPPPAPPPKAE